MLKFVFAAAGAAMMMVLAACSPVIGEPRRTDPVEPTSTTVNTRTIPAPTSDPDAESTGDAGAVAATAEAGNADVEFVRAVEGADGTWTFRVTVRHPDTGWEDYADGWDVLTADGTVLKRDADSPFTRLLAHPHVDEQPFTRSQGGIIIPPGTNEVRVRAHDIVAGYGGREVLVDLTIESGPGFQVERAE
jgi:hypothetical protein